MFHLPLGACNRMVFEGASEEELSKKYCVLRYNVSSGQSQQREFFNTLEEANDYFVDKAKLEGKNVKKEFHGNAHKWINCEQ